MDIVGKSKTWIAISIVLLTIGLGALVFNAFFRGSALNLGIDFTGGSIVSLKFDQDVSIAKVRGVLAKYGFGDAVIQKTGKDVLSIRTEPIEVATRIQILDDFEKLYGNVELLEADIVGPVIGKELRGQAIWALIIASLLIVAYVSFRFEFKYALAALFAVYHDAIITTGIVALLWRNIEIPFVAALLTILGYSINDTIVIFDRIRENVKKAGGSKKNFPALVNKSILQTLGRSVNTVLTVLFMVVALLIFGGATLRDFCFVLLIGFIAGTYSSIFVASPLVVMWEKYSSKK